MINDEEPPDAVVLNPPSEIWLNFGELERDYDYKTNDCEVTWCVDNVYPSDVRYVLAAAVPASPAASVLASEWWPTPIEPPNKSAG